MSTVDNQKKSQTSGKVEDSKEIGFFNRQRAGGKTMWDWLNLLGILAIPIVVAGATLLFGIQQTNLANQQHENDQKIANQQHQQDQQSALDQQQAAILQTYIDNIQDLLLNHNLLKSNQFDRSNPYNDVSTLARARTITALQGLDPERKGLLVQFIYDAQLIGFENFEGKITDIQIINLFGADLSGASLIGANLSGANLRDVYLGGATLAIANLSHAQNLTQQQLDQVLTCKGAILPKGLTCHHNQ